MRNFETEFAQELQNVSAQARRCAATVFSELAFHHCARDVELNLLVNRHPDFWLGVVAAQQSAGIVAMGRLYDLRRQTRTVHTLLERAATYRGLFSRQSLRARKCQLDGLDAALSEEYVRDAFEPQEGFLAPWITERQRLHELYERTVEPLRHQVFAHNRGLPREEIDALFASLPVVLYSELAVFPMQVCEALWQLHRNGRDPDMGSYQVRTDVAWLVDHPIPSGHVTWHEHHRAVGFTAAFLESLRQLP
jgi:hypothetical protein